MKFKHLLLIISLVVTAKVYSGKDTVIVYTTYENYVNKIGETYDKMVNYYGTIKMKITVSKNATETTIKCKEIWGFLYNGHLFRTDERTGQVGELIVKGKICYYENGIAHLEMIRNGTNHENFNLGYYCYVSKDLASKLAPFPSPEYPISDANKQIKKFKRANPEYDDLFKAINNNYSYQNVRAKVIIFNRNFPDNK